MFETFVIKLIYVLLVISVNHNMSQNKSALYSSKKKKLHIDFKSLITKLVDMTQATPVQDAMGPVALGIRLEHVQQQMCDKLSVSA